MMPKPKIVFIHSPRTGGSSANRAFFKNYNKNEIWITRTAHFGFDNMWQGAPFSAVNEPRDLKNIYMVTGHVRLKDIAYLKKRGYSFITMLRDPIDRTISHYDWVLKRYISKIPHNWKDRVKNTTLLEFTRKYENLQYRTIGGYDLSIFNYIGFCEMHEESLRKMEEMFGLSLVHGIHAKGTKPKHRTIATEEEREKMMPYLKKDYKLYNIARELYDR